MKELNIGSMSSQIDDHQICQKMNIESMNSHRDDSQINRKINEHRKYEFT